MSTAQTPHSVRIEAAHDRLLAALRIPAEAKGATIDALVSRRGDALGGALASLIGSLIAEAERTDLITPARIAQAVERTLGQYAQAATETTAALLAVQAQAAVVDEAEHPWDAPYATALVDVRDASATVLHALPPIDFPGRVAGAEPGPRCGAQGATVLFAADVTCPACLEQMGESAACGRCRRPFDPADTGFDGRARYRDTKFCRGCIDQCHEGDADHRCIICAPGGAR